MIKYRTCFGAIEAVEVLLERAQGKLDNIKGMKPPTGPGQ